MTETDLWRRWKERRDRDAFERLVAAHGAFVHDFARRVCGHDADAEDIAQEAFLDLAEAPLDRPLQVGLRAFLGRRIVLAAKTLKRAALSRRAKEAQAPLPATPGPILRPETEEALALLEDEERHAVVLRFLHGLSYAEAAEVLGITEGAARVRVHRALRRLRERLGPRAERAIAALPLFLPAATFSRAATNAALLEGGAVLMTASANRCLVVALVFLLLAGGLVAARFVPSRAPARAPTRTATATTGAPGTGTELGPVSQGEPSPSSTISLATRTSALAAVQPSTAATTCAISGRLRFADGTPVRGMCVDTMPGDKGTRTDEDGRFTFDSLLDQPHTLYQLGPGENFLSIAEIPVGTRELDLVIERGFSLEGGVQVEGTAAPVPEALLELRRPGAAANGTAQAARGTAKSDVDGRFRFEHIPRGTYEIMVTAKGCEPLKMTVEAREGLAPVQVVVKPARDMTVRFANLPAGMVGRKVRLGIWGLADTGMRVRHLGLEIDSKHEIHVEAPPPGRYGINVHAIFTDPAMVFGHKQSEFESLAGEPVVVVLEGAAGARVEGTLVLPDGSPAADRRVQLARSQIHGRTDLLGRFVFADAPAGEERLLLREGETELPVAAFTVPPEGVVRHDVRLTGTGSISGRFTSAQRERNAHVALHRKSDGQPVASVRVGSEGRFQIPYLDPGDYELVALVARKGSMRRDVTVASAAVDLGDIALEPMPDVPVVATVPTGVRVAGEVSVTAKGAEGEAYGWLALGDDGKGFLRGLRPGRYRISFTAPGCAPLEIDIEVETEPSRPLDLTLLPK